MRPRAFIFCVKQCLVSPFMIPANHDPGVQIGYAPGRHYLPYAYNGGKHLKIFPKTTRPKACIFSV